MRYRRVCVTPKPDGSVTVVSHGPIVAFGRLLVPVWLAMFAICFFWQLFVGHFSTAGVFLFLFALFMPNFCKAAPAGREGRTPHLHTPRCGSGSDTVAEGEDPQRYQCKR